MHQSERNISKTKCLFWLSQAQFFKKTLQLKILIDRDRRGMLFNIFDQSEKYEFKP